MNRGTKQVMRNVFTKLKDIFRKTPPKYTPNNRIEELLRDANIDPAKRPEFIKQIFHHNVFIEGVNVTQSNGEEFVKLFPQGRPDNQRVIVAYTSINAFFCIYPELNKPDADILKISFETLFRIIEGKYAVELNPGLPHGKVFSVPEISALLSGNAGILEPIIFNKGDTMYIGKPKVRPEAFMSALRSYTDKSTIVENIYLGQSVLNLESHDYFIAVKFREDQDPKNDKDIYRDLVIIAGETDVKYEVAFMRAEASHIEMAHKGMLFSII